MTTGPGFVAVRGVTFLGLVDDAAKASAMRSADVYCAPNTGESFGIVLVEAMAAGTAVVASDLDAFRRVLEDGAAGRLVPVDDSAALASALIEMLSNDVVRERYVEAAAKVDGEAFAAMILTGSERGWIEVEALAPWASLGLGPFVLRAETAAALRRRSDLNLARLLVDRAERAGRGPRARRARARSRASGRPRAAGGQFRPARGGRRLDRRRLPSARARASQENRPQ